MKTKLFDWFKLMLMGLGSITLATIVLLSAIYFWPTEPWTPMYQVGDCVSVQLQSRIYTLKIVGINEKKEYYSVSLIGDPSNVYLKIPKIEFEDDFMGVIKEECPVQESFFKEDKI